MYKILIVDDEPIILKGLRRFINWENYGFSIVSEALNGEEAVKEFVENPVDVIITDVRMPKVDGFGLINQIHELGYNPVFVILSGYSDFEYAREAIKKGVKDYLLKPFQEEELVDVISKLKRELDGEDKSGNPLTDEILKEYKNGDNERRIIKPILIYMENHLKDDKLLENLSLNFSLSQNYVSFLMKEQLGRGFLQILTQMRIDKAKELLRTNLTLKSYEIAGLVGYEDPQYFSRLFRKKTGMTPTEYRDHQ